MVLASTNVHVVEPALPQIWCQALCPQGGLQWPPPSTGDSLRSAGRSDPGSFQMTASALGCSAPEILCAPFKSGVSVPHSPLELLKVSSTGLQSLAFWGLVFLLQTPYLLGRSSENCSCCPICELPTWGYTATVPPHFSLWFILDTLSCRRSSLVSYGLWCQLFCKELLFGGACERRWAPTLPSGDLSSHNSK